MATLNANVMTLAEWAKRRDPDGKLAAIVELLEQTNEILNDMLFAEGNLPTGHRTTVRTGLPSVFWRLLNTGVPGSRSTTAQIDEQAGTLEAWSEVDQDLAELNGDVGAYRLSEAQAYIEAMNQEMAGTVIYGNAGVAPEEFTGLAPRYSLLSAGNGQNILNAGGTGSGNTSIWLVVWGAQTCMGIFPKGSKAGLVHEDYGKVTVDTSAGVGGARMRAYQERYQWKAGIALKDWRYVVRICNIKVSDLLASTGTQAVGASTRLFDMLAKSTHRPPALGMGRAAFYANRTVQQQLDVQARQEVSGGGGLTYADVQGKRVVSYRGIPIRTVDAILETEQAVA